MCDTHHYLQMNAGSNNRGGNKPNHCQVPFRLVKSAKNLPFHHNHTWKSDCSNGLMSQQVNVEKKSKSNIYGTVLSVSKHGGLTVS